MSCRKFPNLKGQDTVLEGKVERTSYANKTPFTFLPECYYSLHKYQCMLYKIYLLYIHVTGLKISFSENDQKSFDHTGKAVSTHIQ